MDGLISGGAYIRNNIFVWKWMGLYPGGLKSGILRYNRYLYLQKMRQLGSPQPTRWSPCPASCLLHPELHACKNSKEYKHFTYWQYHTKIHNLHFQFVLQNCGTVYRIMFVLHLASSDTQTPTYFVIILTVSFSNFRFLIFFLVFFFSNLTSVRHAFE